MSVILYLLGILVAAAGIAAIGFGIPINEFTLGTTLVITGTTALTGGLILIGLAAVVGELGRVADGLKARVVARPIARTGETAEPAVSAAARPARSAGAVSERPRPEAPTRETRAPGARATGTPSAVDVSATAIDRLRSAIPRTERPKAEPAIVAENEEVPLSPDGVVPEQPSRPSGGEAAPVGPKVTAEDRAGGAAVEALKASRLDFLFRSRPARPAPQAENFDALWPAGSRAGGSAETAPEPAADQVQAVAEAKGQQPDQAAPAPERPPEPAAGEESGTAAVLKSGVVDGMAYTLYADGSIEAKLPDGTVKFGSIAELRAHIESNS
jgi:hypothetical protein